MVERSNYTTYRPTRHYLYGDTKNGIFVFLEVVFSFLTWSKEELSMFTEMACGCVCCEVKHAADLHVTAILGAFLA